MISYGRWILILFVSVSAHAYDIDFYRTLDTPYASGKSDQRTLTRSKLSTKTQVWVQVEWESDFGVFQQGWVNQEHLQSSEKLGLEWALINVKKSFARQMPFLQSPTITHLENLTPVKIIGTHVTTWFLSFKKSHGFVWWTNPDELKLFQVPNTKPLPDLSTADIFKRKLFDIASHPDAPELQVASSKGVYLSRDGKTWRQIALFEKSNLPVLFSDKGTLFVGGYRSDDEGETFQPILRWDRVASQVIKATQRTPNSLQILELDRDEENILMTIGLGKRKKIKLASKDDGLSWSVFHTPPASHF